MKKILLIAALILLVAAVAARDRTPYRFIVALNGCKVYTGPVGWTYKELAERYDGAGAGIDILRRLWDTAKVYNIQMCENLFPYWSLHEVNLANYNPTTTYQARLNDSINLWHYHYLKDYCDSLSLPFESVFIHINNTTWQIGCGGEIRTGAFSNGLAKNRMNYQFWDNQVGDTFYPSGYYNLANGLSSVTVGAMRYALRRHVYNDSLTDGPGSGTAKGHWTGFFVDNAQATLNPLSSYYTFVGATGPTTLEMREMLGVDFRNDPTSLWWRGVGHLFAEVSREIGLRGGGDVKGWVNSPTSYYFNAVNVMNVMIDSIDAVLWEAGWEPDKGKSTWLVGYQLLDICRAKKKYNAMTQQATNFTSGTIGAWFDNDVNRILLGLYGHWLCARDSVSFYNPTRCYYDSMTWPAFYERNFGEYSGSYSIVAQGITGTWLMTRRYDSGDVRVYARTGGADWTVPDAHAFYMTDYYTVTPGGTWYVMDKNTGVFGTEPITSFQIRPCETYIIANEPAWDGPHHSSPYSYITGANPVVYLNPPTINVSAIVGGTNPGNRTVAVSNIGGGSMVWTATKPPAHTWYSISPAGGTGNGTLTLTFNTSGLTVGSTTSPIQIASVGADNTPQYVTVNLTMNAPVGIPHLEVSPESFAFTKVFEEEGPDSAKLLIANVGSGQMDWIITKSMSWLSLSTFYGAEPETLIVTVELPGGASPMPVGIYYDTIVVTSDDADNSPVNIPVTLTIEAAPPPPPPVDTTRHGKHIRGVRKKP